MTIALAMLTLDEVDGLRAVLPRVPWAAVDEVFAVDGGSTDGTLELYAAHGIRTIAQTTRGRGAAFQLAFASCAADAVIFFSPDGNEDPDDIPRFRRHLEAGADMVIASRMMAGARNEEDEQVIRPRKWANLAFNRIAALLWCRGEPASDAINGFRAITRRAWTLLEPDALGYAVEYQTTIRAYKAGLAVGEFPTHEGQRIAGTTKAPSMRTGLTFLRLLAHELRVGRRFLSADPPPPHARGGRGAPLAPRTGVSVVIPVRDEGENVRDTLEELWRVVPRVTEVLIAYDEEDDSSLPVARELARQHGGVELVRNRLGVGPAGALRSGIAAARGEVVVLMSGDGSDEPRSINEMLDLIDAGWDVVNAARVGQPHDSLASRLKELLGRWATRSLRWWTGMPIDDLSYLFKAVHADVLEAIQLESRRGFEVGVEIVVKAFASGRRVTSVRSAPRPRLRGQSKFRVLRWLPSYLHWYRRGLALRQRGLAG